MNYIFLDIWWNRERVMGISSLQNRETRDGSLRIDFVRANNDLDLDLARLNILPSSIPSREADKDCITLRNLCLRLPLAIISARPFKYRKLRCASCVARPRFSFRIADFSYLAGDAIQSRLRLFSAWDNRVFPLWFLSSRESRCSPETESGEIPKSKIVKYFRVFKRYYNIVIKLHHFFFF